MIKSVRLVVAVFTNVLFVLGVIFLVVGVIQGIKFVGYKLLLPEYPSRFGEDCSYIGVAYPVPVMDGSMRKVASGSAEAEDIKEQIQACERRVSQGRQVKQIDDVALTVGMILSGLLLIWLFNPKGMWAVKE